MVMFLTDKDLDNRYQHFGPIAGMGHGQFTQKIDSQLTSRCRCGIIYLPVR